MNPADKEQTLLKHARREGLVILIAWAVALAWSVGSAYVLGYERRAGDVSPPVQQPIILGMPAWVFWSVFLPWGICFLFSGWFCFFFMADDDLGADRAGEEHE